MELKRIESFQVNHDDLPRGIYVSRLDEVGEEFVTTFDIRMKAPNKETVLTTGVVHALEHLGATYLRSKDEISDQVIYFGPMGCRTGFYVILKGKKISEDVVPLMKEMFGFINDFSGEIPGACSRDCGNFVDMDLENSITESKIFYNEVLCNLKKENLNYPE